MGNDFWDAVIAKDIGRIISIIGLIAAFITLMFVLFGCAEMPDREMDEHYMQCIVIADGEAFCRWP